MDSATVMILEKKNDELRIKVLECKGRGFTGYNSLKSLITL